MKEPGLSYAGDGKSQGQTLGTRPNDSTPRCLPKRDENVSTQTNDVAACSLTLQSQSSQTENSQTSIKRRTHVHTGAQSSDGGPARRTERPILITHVNLKHTLSKSDTGESLIDPIPFIPSSRIGRTTGVGTSRISGFLQGAGDGVGVGWAGWVQGAQGHEEAFWSDGSALYLEWGGG